MNWISNVEKCIDEADAIKLLETEKKNVMYSQSIDMSLSSNDMKWCESTCLYYIEMLFPYVNTVDIITNIRSDDDYNNFMRILIDGEIVNDIDSLFTIACPSSEIKCRFYLNNGKKSGDSHKTICMDCIILSTENKAKLNLNSLDTPYFYYRDGKCIPRNISIMYFSNS